MQRPATLALFFALLVLVSTADGADEKQPPSPRFNQFGINPHLASSPPMLDAMNRLSEAGKIEGRRGSLTFFRWSGAEPPQLAHLGLWGANVGNAEIALTSLLPDLEHVSLYETNVDDDGLAPLARLPKLRSLSITPITRYEKAGFGPPQWSYPFMESRDDRPRITGQGLQAFADVATLEKADLLDVQLTSADLALLAAWPKLSALSLPNPIDSATVQHLQACKKLNNLTLGHREITAAELESLAEWKSLRRLTLIHARLSDDALAALSKLTTVEELRLEDCGLTDERLRHLRGTPNLKDLSLVRNEIDGPGLKYLTKLNLRALGLEFNNLNDDTLAHLTQLTTLENLGLSYCRGVTDRGIRSGTLQSMTHLKLLAIRGTTLVTDASLDDLAKFGHLEHLTIRETKISGDGVERLKQAMPKTVVFK